MASEPQNKKTKFRKTLRSRIKFWCDYDRLRYSKNSINDTIKIIFTPRQARYPQSFQETMDRYNLTESDIEEKKRAFLRLTWLMFLLSVLVFCYALYHFLKQQYSGAIVSLSLTFVPLALTFRYHFWYVQLKKRKLGCTIREWFNYITGRQL